MANLLTESEAAAVIGVSRQRIRQFTNEGRLRYTVILGRRGIKPEDAAAFKAIERRPGPKSRNGSKPSRVTRPKGKKK